MDRRFEAILNDILEEEIENNAKCEHGILLKFNCVQCNEISINNQRTRDIDQHYYGGQIK